MILSRSLFLSALAALSVAFLTASTARAQFVYVADNSGNTIKRYDSTGAASTFSLVGGTLSAPWGLTFDSNGDIYVADGGTNSIKKIVVSGSTGTVSTFATGNGLSNPRGLVFDSSGNLYVANSSTTVISKFTAAGSAATFTTSGVSYSNIDQMAFDSAGNLYVASQGTGNVRKIVISGTAGTVSNFVTQTGNTVGIAIDKSDNIYVGRRDGVTPSRVDKYNTAAVLQTFTLSGGTPLVIEDMALDTSGNNLYYVSGGSTVGKIAINGSSGTVTQPFTASPGLSFGRGIATNLSGASAPEPGTLVFIALGGTLTLFRRRRK